MTGRRRRTFAGDRSILGMDDSDGREWRFDGSEPLREPVEPGSPTPENVAFLLLGVAVALTTIATFLL